MEEKLEGMKELSEEKGGGQTAGYMKTMEEVPAQASSADVSAGHWYGVEIYNRGERILHSQDELFHELESAPATLYNSLKSAAEAVSRQISDRADVYEEAGNTFCGVIYEYAPYPSEGCMRAVKKYIVSPNGKIIYAVSCGVQGFLCCETEETGQGNRIFAKIPVPSGTLVEMADNPFFPSVKGAIVNETEPDEAGFLEERNSQWLISADTYNEQTKGIRITDLNEYNTHIMLGADFPVSFEPSVYSQFLKRYEGELPENEKWLSEMSEAVKRNKDCIWLLLKDRQPGSGRAYAADERLRYVKQLLERLESNKEMVL